MLIEVIRWRGPGYYGPAQRGSHEKTHIAYSYLGDDAALDIDREARRQGVGTPVWLDEPTPNMQVLVWEPNIGWTSNALS